MPRFVAFLRGMNLGRRRITNDELCACFVGMGLDNVSAFLASGNVLFEVADSGTRRLAAKIEAGLASALEYEVPTFLRSAGAVRAIAETRPFSAAELEAGGKPQVLLLASGPNAEARELVERLATEDDRLVFGSTELFWLPSAGILDSELDLKLIERTLGPTTMRTHRTLERLAAKLD